MSIREVEKGIWGFLECLLLYEISHQDLQDWDAAFRRSAGQIGEKHVQSFGKGSVPAFFSLDSKRKAFVPQDYVGKKKLKGFGRKGKRFLFAAKALEPRRSQDMLEQVQRFEKEAIKSQRKGERRRSSSIFGV